MNDQQFDRVLKSALSWQAHSAMAMQPPMRLAARKLAVRLGPSSPSTRPRLLASPAPATLSLGQLMLILLLLLSLLAGTLVIGSWLLERRGPADAPRLFGYTSSCDSGRLEGGAMMAFSAGGAATYTYPDGRLLTDASGPTMAQEPMPPRADIVRGVGYLERVLSQRGNELMIERVREAGLTDGCRRLRSNGSTGMVLVNDAAVTFGADWSPDAGNGSFGLARDLTTGEELVLTELIADLRDPVAWLPDDAWVRQEEVFIRPDDWRIVVSLDPTGLEPADVLTLPGGGELTGSDPRYASIILPGGVKPAAFGEEVVTAAGQTYRCGVVTRADAIRLAESIDDLGIGHHGFDPDGWMREEWGGGLFTPDLSQAVSFGIDPLGSFPGLPDVNCAAVSAPEPSFEPSPTRGPVSGDLAEVDPCSLLPADDPRLRAPGRRIPMASQLRLDVPARECALIPDTAMGWPPHRVTLYPSSVDLAEARDIVDGVLGRAATEEEVATVAVWRNRCFGEADQCSAGAAIWADQYLLFVTAEPYVSRPATELLIEVLVESLAD